MARKRVRRAEQVLKGQIIRCRRRSRRGTRVQIIDQASQWKCGIDRSSIAWTEGDEATF